jgi:hypothetical protein
MPKLPYRWALSIPGYALIVVDIGCTHKIMAFSHLAGPTRTPTLEGIALPINLYAYAGTLVLFISE